MKAKKLLADPEAIEKWISKEKESLEKNGAYLEYWFHSGNKSGFGITLTGIYSGEFHLESNGKNSMYVEGEPGEVLFSSEGTATTEHTLHELFNNFKNKILHENT